jgi:hypothetical protein
MKIAPWISVVCVTGLAALLVSLLFAIPVLAQDPLKGALSMGMGDVADIKKRAEAGDAAAQVALGDALVHNMKPAEGFQWYRKAAVQGNVEGEYRIGETLLFMGPDKTNLAERCEGLRWTFMAATNHYPYACENMSRALREALGTSTDFVAAYAWLELFSETSAGGIVGRVEMNNLALKMSTADLERARQLFSHFKTGRWQFPTLRVIPEGDSRLKLNGVIVGVKFSQVKSTAKH